LDNCPDWIRSTRTFHSSLLEDGEVAGFTDPDLVVLPPFFATAGVFDVWTRDRAGLLRSAPAVQQRVKVSGTRSRGERVAM
jgi:hypothetical protein